MKHTPIKISKITAQKYQTKFKLLPDDICTKIDLTISGNSIEEIIQKAESLLGEKVKYEIK